MTTPDEKTRNFIAQIKTNLSNNDFPGKKVSFNLERLYELADQKDVNLNQVREILKNENIKTVSSGDKLIFSFNSSNMPSLDEAKQMFNQMSQDEKDSMMKMFQNMSEDQKKELFQKGKDLGFI